MVDVSDLTSGTVDGTGIFDVLMQSVNKHLQEQYGQNRIKGGEYATVYLSSLQSAMAEGSKYLVQLETVKLLQAQAAKEEKEVELTEQQIVNLKCENAKCQAQIKLIEAQLLNVPKEGAVLDNSINKSAEEVLLLRQKVITEKGQTDGTVFDTDSVLGKQTNLYTAQTEGYARDAEYKLLSKFIETWGIRRTTDDATQVNATNKLADQNIGQVVTKALSGIGLNAL